MALPALEAVAGVATELAVMSQPDKPVGRKKVLTPTPVSSWALERGVTLFRPADHDGIAEAVAQFAPDLGVTVAFGRILRHPALAGPSMGWWNVHFSRLPRWRGAAPVQNALLAGDTDTGVSLFRLDEGMDTGPLLGQRDHAITPGITAGALLDELSHLGADLLAHTLHQHHTGTLGATEQEGPATHAPKLERETGRITSTDALEQAQRRFQATTPEPGCFVSWGGGENTLRILSVDATADFLVTDPAGHTPGSIQATPRGIGLILSGGALVLENVQPAGKKVMPAVDWWRGVHEEIRIDD